jgi:hypothetical protein
MQEHSNSLFFGTDMLTAAITLEPFAALVFRHQLEIVALGAIRARDFVRRPKRTGKVGVGCCGSLLFLLNREIHGKNAKKTLNDPRLCP